MKRSVIMAKCGLGQVAHTTPSFVSCTVMTLLRWLNLSTDLQINTCQSTQLQLGKDSRPTKRGRTICTSGQYGIPNSASMHVCRLWEENMQIPRRKTPAKAFLQYQRAPTVSPLPACSDWGSAAAGPGRCSRTCRPEPAEPRGRRSPGGCRHTPSDRCSAPSTSHAHWTIPSHLGGKGEEVKCGRQGKQKAVRTQFFKALLNLKSLPLA